MHATHQMNAIVIYDSAFGNTAQIAVAISTELCEAPVDSLEVQLLKIDGVKPDHLSGLDLLIVGSPTRGFRPTPAVLDLIKRLPKDALKGVKVAGFDTRFTEEMIDSQGALLSKLVDVFGYAAEPISDRLLKKGGELAIPPEGFYVEDTEGPLLDGELERAADWARKILAEM